MYNIAEGSLEELKYYFILSLDLGYLDDAKDEMIAAEQISPQLYGLIMSTQRRLKSSYFRLPTPKGRKNDTNNTTRHYELCPSSR